MVEDKEGFHVCADVCGAYCCSGNVYLRDESIERLEGQGYSGFSTVREGVQVMKTGENKDCVFLEDDNTCEIYDSRPLDCRLFPMGFEISDSTVNLVLVECPLSRRMGDDSLESLEEEAKDLLEDFSREELEEYDSLDFAGDYKRVSSFPMLEVVEGEL